jgi:hypothetical protein
MQFASQAEALHWSMDHADDEMGAARGLRAWREQVQREGGRIVADAYLVAAVSSPALYAWRARAYWIAGLTRRDDPDWCAAEILRLSTDALDIHDLPGLVSTLLDIGGAYDSSR